MSVSQQNKLKSGIKNGTKILLKLTSNVFGDSNDESNSLYKLRLTNAQVWKLRKVFANGSLANIKLWKNWFAFNAKCAETFSFEIQNYYQNKPKFKGVYSRKNIPEIKDRAYVINLDEFKSIGTQWIVLSLNSNNWNASYDVIYIDSCGVEHIPKEIKRFIGNKNIMINIYRMQAYNLITSEYFCIGLNNFVMDLLILDYTSLLSPNECEKNDKIMLKYCQ